MPQSYTKVLIHIVFSTKYRTPYLKNRELRSRTHAYLGSIAKKISCDPIRIGGPADHVHLLTTLSRTISIAEFVKELKRASTTWIRQRHESLSKFHRQIGYGVFSVNATNADVLIRYIENQESHHAKENFQDEYRTLLRDRKVPFDEKYLWD